MEIFDGIKIKKQKAFVYVIYGCGLRRGEALALERSDFDFKAKKLTINKPAFDENMPYIKSTKSQNGIREFPILSNVLPFLQEYCKCLKGSILFCTSGKNTMTKSSYVKL